MIDFNAEALELFPHTRALRRDLHRHPELGFEEVRTAGIIARELGECGLEVTPGIAGTGVAALLRGGSPGPAILLRFDMDALPIEEQTGAEYASLEPGRMHACGHDGHVAIGLTVARLLGRHRDQLRGEVKFAFQPAEETAGGALRMIEEGILDNPAPVHVLGVHIWNEKPLGWLGLAAGPVMAATGEFRLRVTGKGGHGAIPHQAVDPVVASAHIITAIQSIVSRNVDPQQACVISLCQLRAGNAFNVIPHEVEIKGTIRGYDAGVLATARQRMEEIIHGVARAMGCQADLELSMSTSAVVNDQATTEAVKRAARRVLPDSDLDERGRFTMGAEDFSAFQERVPGTFVFLGSANEEAGLAYSHHHPKFDFDERVLPQAVALLAASVLELL